MPCLFSDCLILRRIFDCICKSFGGLLIYRQFYCCWSTSIISWASFWSYFSFDSIFSKYTKFHGGSYSAWWNAGKISFYLLEFLSWTGVIRQLFVALKRSNSSSIAACSLQDDSCRDAQKFYYCICSLKKWTVPEKCWIWSN